MRSNASRRTRRTRVSLVICLGLLTLGLAACSEDTGPCRLGFRYGAGGGTLRGTLTNHESFTLSSVDLSVTVKDSNRRPIATRSLTLDGPFGPGDSDFSLPTGVAGGRTATIAVVACHR